MYGQKPYSMQRGTVSRRRRERAAKSHPIRYFPPREPVDRKSFSGRGGLEGGSRVFSGRTGENYFPLRSTAEQRVEGSVRVLQVMALAARLWRFLPWGRRVFPGPWLSRGVAGSRGLCCTRRLRGSEVSPPPSGSPHYWLGSGTLLFCLAAPHRHGECGELRKVVLVPGVPGAPQVAATDRSSPFRKATSLKTGVGGGMRPPAPSSPTVRESCWSFLSENRELGGGRGAGVELDRRENVYFWRCSTEPKALSLPDFEKFVV